MKRTMFMKTAIAAMALLIAFGLNSCDKENGVNVAGDYEYLSVALPDVDNSQSEIVDATLEDDVDMCLVERPMGEKQAMGMENQGRHRPIKQFHPFARIFRQLELTAEQKEAVRGYMTEHHDCMKEAMMALRASEREIIQEANQARRAIMQNVKDSVITRAEAREQLRELNADTREALQNNPARAEAREAMCECLLALYANIRATLTEEQQAIWDEWVAGQDLPCDD